MRDYARIVTKVRETPWMMIPESLNAMLTMLDKRLSNGKMTDEELLAQLNDTQKSMLFHGGEHDHGASIAGGIGVLPLYGPIFGKSNLMTEMSGASSLEDFSDNLKAMLKDDGIGSVVLDIDSPGGTSDMVPEVGELIKQGTETKPIYAIANVMSGSAAYWLMSQATKAYVTPSGSVGSIGVYSVHEDQSVKDANEGVRFTYISAGENKTEGNPHEALSEEARAFRQEQVDSFYSDFLEVVASGRNTTVDNVRKNFGGGRMFRPQDALKVGMVDAVMTYDELVSQIASQPQTVKIHIDGKAIAAAVWKHGKLHMESKEWEHSEPGTGQPPEPRKDEDGSDDAAIKGGWRRTTPPDQDATPPVTSSTAFEGRLQMNDEFVLSGKDARELFAALKLEGDVDSAKLVEAIKVQFGELNALRNSVDAKEQERIFAETYPQYWEEHNKLMKRDREHTASDFVTSVSKIRKTEGYGLKDTKQGLSVEAQTVISDTHMKFAEGTATLEDFEKAIKTVVNGGIVQFGEIGTSEGDDIPEWDTNSPAGIAGARQLFAQAVSKVQAENPGMDYKTALVEAAKKHPDLAEAYKMTTPA